MVRRVVVAWALTAMTAASASAQSVSSGTTAAQTTTATQTSSSSTAAPATRPATTTFSGDTGLWFVPTAEVLPAKRWSGSGYRRGINYVQGFTNVADFAGTVGVGLADRAVTALRLATPEPSPSPSPEPAASPAALSASIAAHP